MIDQPQGPHEIRRAAMDAVAVYLDAFVDSSELVDLWENHPLLLEAEADDAGKLAWAIACQLRDLIEVLTPRPIPTTKD